MISASLFITCGSSFKDKLDIFNWSLKLAVEEKYKFLHLNLKHSTCFVPKLPNLLCSAEWLEPSESTQPTTVTKSDTKDGMLHLKRTSLLSKTSSRPTLAS